MVALWRVVSKVGKDSVDYLEGFEGLMHLGLPVTNAGHRRKKVGERLTEVDTVAQPMMFLESEGC